MSSPAEYYNSLPPISKAYGTLCLIATTAFQLGLYSPIHIALVHELVFKHFQIWRLFTNFFFLGKFSINFGIRLLMIARYGVQLENGPFQRRTADFLWMMIFGALSLLALSAIPIFWSPFLGISLVFMLLYVWSREFPNAQINLYGLVTLKAFYLPWAMLALDVIFGSPLIPDLLGILAGHLYYFLTVLHPLAGGKNILKTPLWVYPSSFGFLMANFPWFLNLRLSLYGFYASLVSYPPLFCLFLNLRLSLYGFYDRRHKVVSRWRIGAPPIQRAAPDERNTGGAFRGRSYRLND